MNTFLEMISQADTIAIVGHTSPDGDCVGSCLGLYNFVIEHFSPTKLQGYLEEFSRDFMFLQGADQVCHNSGAEEEYALCISLDCGDTLRHGDFGKYFQTAEKTICVDHHISNQGFGDFCIVDKTASSTAEAIYKLLETDKLSRACAEALYLGIVHDTGVFKHNCTSRQTMEAAGALMECGAQSDYIIDHTFYKKTFIQNRLLGTALSKAELYLEGKVIAVCLTLDDFEAVHATRLDTDGIVDQLRITEGVEAAIFAYQKEKDVFKYSMRSNGNINVSKIATGMGGGGHIRAAGIQVKGAYQDTLQVLLAQMQDQLQENCETADR